MRLSTKHSLVKLAALAIGVALSIACAASTALAGISIEVPRVIGLKVETPGLPIETPSLPTVEVPGVVKVETTPTPAAGSTSPTAPVAKVEVSTTTPVTGAEASVPPVTTTSSTPVSQSPTRTSTTSGTSTAGSHASTSATAADVGAGATTATGTSASSPTDVASATHAANLTRATRGSRDATARKAAKRHAAASGGGATPVDLASGGATPNSTPPSSPTRAATSDDAARKAPASDPLSSLGRQLPLPLPVPDWSKPIILLLLLLAIGFAVRSQLAARRARRLERQRGTLLRDLDAMQAALVPAIPARLDALSVSVGYRPADGPAAGGDFYDLVVLEPGKVAIVLGDVVGHGRDALTRAALTRYTLRAYLQAGLEPRAALALASSVLTEPGEKQFATVVVGVYDSASSRLTYASAGHPPPISVGFQTPEPLTICCSAPLCCDLPTGRRQTTISLPAGGQLCFFSDGLPEARVGDDLLGRERLTELAREPGAPLSADALLARVSAVAQTARDDMVACVISPAGARTPAAAATVEELEVDEEALASPRVPRFLDACGVGSAAAASVLADATRLVAADGTALLRIVLSIDGEASATALPGLSTPDWATDAAVPQEAAVAMLALPAER
jgi:hypothetical protein